MALSSASAGEPAHLSDRHADLAVQLRRLDQAHDGGGALAAAQ